MLANTLLLDNNKQTSMIYLLIFQSSPTHGADYGGLMAAATLTSLPVVVLFVALPEPHLGRADRRRGEGMSACADPCCVATQRVLRRRVCPLGRHTAAAPARVTPSRCPAAPA